MIDLEKYVKLWSLSGFEEIGYGSRSSLFKCVSETHGPCVLKINNTELAESEYRLLREYGGGKFCKVYEADMANNVLLLERIMPGTRLRDEQSLDARLEVFCKLFRGLHIKPANKAAYPTYLDWVSKITKYMSNREDYELLYEKMAEAERICRELFVEYTDRMLLHGDLHHDNILLDERGGYRIIDPKGVIGDRVFDIPRFMLNEFIDIALNDGTRGMFNHIARVLSDELGVPISDIRKLFYIEMCMAHCWEVQSGDEPNVGQVLYAEKLLNG